MQRNANRSSDAQTQKHAAGQGRRLPAAAAIEIGNLFKAFDSDYPHNLKLTLQYLLDLTGGGFAVYHRFREKNQQVYIEQAVGSPAKFRKYGRSNGRVCYEAFGARRPSAISIDDLRSTTFWQSDPDLRRYGLKAFLGSGVRLDGEIIGSLAVYDNQTRKFSADNLAAIEMIAEIVAYLDKHRRAERRLNTQQQHEHMLAEITANAMSALSIDRCLAQCLDVIGNAMNADSVHLFHEDMDGQELSSLANWWQETDTGATPPRDMSGLIALPMVSRVLLTGETYRCNDTEALSNTNVHKQLRRYKIRSFVALPLCHQQFVNGVCFVCMSKASYAWRANEMGILETVAQILAQRLNSRSITHRLDESEALTYQMFQLSPVAIYRIDLDRQRFLAVNDYMCRATGYSKEEFMSLKPTNLLTSESLNLYRKRLKALVEGRPISSNVDYEVITKSGAIEWARLHIRHLFEQGRVIGAMVVAHFITEQKKVREELALYRQELESLVQERTAELAEINRQLRKEIEQRKQTAMELRDSSDRLHEMNTAMSVLLDKRSEDHQRAEELIRLNLKELIDPFLNRLENSGLRSTQKQLLEIIRMNLEEVLGSPTPEFSSKYYMFSPNELQVANLIRQGRTSKEVARLLNLSTRTVDSYRDSIRKKLGLKNKKVNLRTYLASL
jgi:PAS domain S-box-containing protein